ncbi:MAG TPA: lamin tail domain-containing protein, partial [Flavobacteriales bacterium]|nr:lamin tail domain-containing protein [Flavobacteriales bacterium]
MRKVTTLIRHLSMAAGLLLTNAAIAQTTAFSESMGSVGGTTTIAAHEAANGFDNDAQTMTGTADVRNTLPSSGYAGASGLANIFFTNIPGRFFQIEEINTTGFTGIEISFGIHKSTIASNGSDFLVEVSSDGIVYTPLTFPALPAGSGTAVWHYRTATGTIPATANLRVRFTNNSSTTQYRVDDVLLSVPCPNATVTADGPATLCNGGSVTLTANSGDAYLWSNGATTQSITVSSSATFTVTVTNGACVSTSEPVRVLVYPEPIIGVNSSDDAVCPGESVTLNARLVLPDLIFSEYVEGTSNEKYIEIFNGTGAAVNLANYEYHAFHNGISTPGFIVPLSGALADGDVLVLKNGSAVLYPGGTAAFGVQHNGDDALAIYNVVTAS